MLVLQIMTVYRSLTECLKSRVLRLFKNYKGHVSHPPKVVLYF